MSQYNPNIHHRRSIRLKGYDYSQEGLYFITLVCQNRACLFGEITDKQILLNANGQIVHNEWLNTINVRKDDIQLHTFIVMPNHFHAIIEIRPRRDESHSSFLNGESNSSDMNTGGYGTGGYGTGESHSPNIITGVCDTPQRDTPQRDTPQRRETPQRYDTNEYGRDESHSSFLNGELKSSDMDRGVYDTPRGFQSPKGTVGAIIRGFKGAVSRQIGFSVWQRNYYEHIIRNDIEYQRISEYIINNPIKWNIDKINPDMEMGVCNTPQPIR